jgi:hypothetical protein
MPNQRDERRPEQEESEVAEQEREHPGLEGAAEEDAGVMRHAEVEGGDELSIAGSPPSAAGGTCHTAAPTRDDIERR